MAEVERQRIMDVCYVFIKEIQSPATRAAIVAYTPIRVKIKTII